MPLRVNDRLLVLNKWEISVHAKILSESDKTEMINACSKWSLVYFSYHGKIQLQKSLTNVIAHFTDFKEPNWSEWIVPHINRSLQIITPSSIIFKCNKSIRTKPRRKANVVVCYILLIPGLNLQPTVTLVWSLLAESAREAYQRR